MHVQGFIPLISFIKSSYVKIAAQDLERRVYMQCIFQSNIAFLIKYSHTGLCYRLYSVCVNTLHIQVGFHFLCKY